MMGWLRRAGLACVVAVAVGEASAEVNVASTIAPVHSLVSMVTEGVAAPALIVKSGASPHGHAMKPSEARALDEADVVFWVGEAIEPWMVKAISTLAADAMVVELGAAEGVAWLGVREGGVWDGHGREDHDDDIEGQDHEKGSRGRLDPHLWLDPDNAIAWLQVMAAELSTIDPDNTETYLANAEHAIERLTKMALAIEVNLAVVKATPYIVFHDAYQYFERRFDLSAVGSISLSDADRPGAAHITEIKNRIQESGAVCAFAEPQFEPKLLDIVIEGSNARKAVLDPIGADLEPGMDLYPLLMKRMAASLIDCLS